MLSTNYTMKSGDNLNCSCAAQATMPKLQSNLLFFYHILRLDNFRAV